MGCCLSTGHNQSHNMAVNKEQLAKAKELLTELIKSKNCGPIMIRIAWHDSGTFDKTVTAPWPAAGGANGSIRFDPEINHGANAGLSNAVKMLEGIKASVPDVSYADLIQMASALSVEIMGGPKIEMQYGRKDVMSKEGCPAEGNLPAGNAPWPKGASSAAEHLRDIFHRMGFDDQEIVALSGAHSVGRAYKDRSGEGKEKTKYTESPPNGSAPGGSSWTPNWLTFDNSYFVQLVKGMDDPDLLVLATDKVLVEDAAFRPVAIKYGNNQDAFFSDYAAAHKKLSELGSQWVEGGSVVL